MSTSNEDANQPNSAAQSDSTLKRMKDGSSCTTNKEGPDAATQYDSPKKKAKLCLGTLRSSTKKGGACYIGSLLKLPQISDRVVKRGEVRDVTLRCTVTENRSGRLSGSDAARTLRRFICIADFTGFVSLGMVANETRVSDYDVPSEECDERTRCFFNAEISGTFACIPTRGNPEAPTFFLNNGSVKKIKSVEWNGENRLSFPTSDVCRQMINSKYASSSFFMTTGFCGRIDVCCANSEEDVVLSLEDPVGYVAVEICIEGTNLSVADYMERNELTEGNYVFLSGELAIQGFGTTDNAVLKVSCEKVKIDLVKKNVFDRFVTSTLETDRNIFSGNKPEKI